MLASAGSTRPIASQVRSLKLLAGHTSSISRELTKAPIAAEAVKRIDVLFAIEREINGLAPQERLRVR